MLAVAVPLFVVCSALSDQNSVPDGFSATGCAASLSFDRDAWFCSGTARSGGEGCDLDSCLWSWGSTWLEPILRDATEVTRARSC